MPSDRVMADTVVAVVATTTVTLPNAAVEPEAAVFVTATLPGTEGACSGASDRAGAGSSTGSTSGEVVERRVDGDGASNGDDSNGSKHNGDNAAGRLVTDQIACNQSERRADGDLTSQRL